MNGKFENTIKKLMAFMLVLCFLIPSINVYYARAAAGTVLDVEVTQTPQKTMVEGTRNSIPSVSYSNREDEQVFMSWDFNTMFGSPFVNGQFTLDYIADTNKKIEITVKKMNTYATVEYSQYVYASGSAIDTWEKTNIVSSSAIRVYSHIAPGDITAQYTELSKYLQQYNGADDSHRVLNPYELAAAGDDDAYKKIAFNISRDMGFSFIVDNQNLHFLWNAGTGKFILVTNGIKTGNIYEMNLHSSNNASSGDDKQYVLTGVNLDTFRSIPLANGTAGGYNTTSGKDDAFSKPLDIDSDLSDMARPLVMTGEGGNGDDAHPGSPDAGIELRFDEPSICRYDSGTNSYIFAPISSSGNNDIKPLSMTITMRQLDATQEITINIKDILKDQSSIGDSSNYTINSGGTAEIESVSRHRVDGRSTDNRIGIRLGNMSPGIVFDTVTVQLNHSKLRTNYILVKDPNYPGYPSVYTFLDYKIEYSEGNFYALVTPYKGYEGYYMLKNRGVPSVTKRSDGSSILMLPLDITATGRPYGLFQIFFRPFEDFPNNNTDGAVFSQSVDYKAKKEDLMIGIPNNFIIVSNNLYPLENSPTGEEGSFEFTARWDIASGETIAELLSQCEENEPLVIEYKINRGLTPDIDEVDTLETVKLSIQSAGRGYTVTYTGANGKVVQAENVVLNSRTENLGTASEREIYYAEVSFKASAAHKKISEDATADFWYPDIYFLNVKPFTVNGKNASNIGGSLFASVTLNDLTKQMVAPPQSLSAFSPKTSLRTADAGDEEVSFKVSWDMPVNNLKDYYNNVSPSIKHWVSVNLYISQDESYLRGEKQDVYGKLFTEYDRTGREGVSVASEYPHSDAYDTRLYFSDINGNTGLKPDPVDSRYNDLRAALRASSEQVDKKVVEIKDVLYMSLEKAAASGAALTLLTLDGLDKNQKYYVCADLAIFYEDADGTLVLKDSALSNLEGITTEGEMDVPGDEEKIPPAPTPQTELLNDGAIGLVHWNKINPESGDLIEYEIIRLKDAQMDSTLLDTRQPFETFFTSLSNEQKVGMRTDETKSPKLEIYSGSAWAAADNAQYTYDSSGDPVLLQDYTLTPNQLYFYYVRTVRIVNGERIYSTWAHSALTTSPVKAPVNLKVELGRTDYNPKTEVVVSFDAPITDLSKLGSDINLQYQLRQAGGTWGNPVTMDVSQLKSQATASTLQDYTHFIYKITGLTAGETYSIRVAMRSGEDVSMYTNSVDFRTDMDQGEYDKDKSTQDWLAYMKEQLEKLLKKPYWLTKDTTTEFEAIYRPTMFNDVLNSSTDSMIRLAESTAEKIVYYLPASGVISANEANKGFLIPHGSMEIILSPRSTEYNDAINQVTNSLNKKEISDYYLRVTVIMSDLGSGSGLVDGNDALSKQANVTVDAVGSSKTNRALDDEVLNELTALVSAKAEETGVKNNIMSMIARNATSEELVAHVESLINNVKSQFLTRTNTLLHSSLRTAYVFKNLEAPLIIVEKSIDPAASVSGYRFTEGLWIAQETSPHGDYKAIYTIYPGVYVFAGRIVIIPGIENVQGSGTITEIVAKYGLDDFFGKDSAFNIEANTTRSQLANSIARMAGAPKGSDPFDWLAKNKNITISSRNAIGDISTQESVYLVMLLYESKTNTKVSAIKIRNFSATAGIKNIDTKYLQSVRAAFETGVYIDKSMQPRDSIKVKDFLEMLYRLDSKARL